VHVYEATEIMHDVRHVTAALEPWQARSGSLSEDAACTSPRASPATWDVVTPPWTMCSGLFSVATAGDDRVRYHRQRGVTCHAGSMGEPSPRPGWSVVRVRKTWKCRTIGWGQLPGSHEDMLAWHNNP
jgi:hypothetical protein